MKVQQFLDYHGVATNPFAEEDAQTDPVFKEHCIASTYHATWDKVYGDPAEPATSIVFGEKGSGKTALRLQIARHLARYNQEHPNQRVFVIEYDDFNPFLDQFRDSLRRGRRQSDKVLSQWKLWDHMDAILSLGVTRLVDCIVQRNSARTAARGNEPHAGPLETAMLSRHQARDLLLLAACYDRSSAEPFNRRWHRLRRALRFRTWRTWWHSALGVAVTLLVVALIVGLQQWTWLAGPWPYLGVAAGWSAWLLRCWRYFWRSRAVTRQLRALHHETNRLRRVLMNFTAEEISGQPLPNAQRTDDRFELLLKFQGVLGALGFTGTLVLVDRVDEPHLINGSPERMKAFLWPMLDNKFLKHPGLGFKLLLPIELSYFIDREDRDFYQRARLDKQNLIPSLEWTGEALYDVANDRLKACAVDGQTPKLGSLFDESVGQRRIVDALRTLRVPRHLFRFLYRVFVTHCNAHTEEDPVWHISGETFESELALYQRDQEAFDRGLGAG